MAEEANQDFIQTKGSLLTTLYTERKVKAYPVTDNELETLSMFNTESVMFFSIGTGLLGYAADSLRDALAASPHGNLKLVCSFIFLALLCYGLGSWRFWKRHTLVRSIKAQSQTE